MVFSCQDPSVWLHICYSCLYLPHYSFCYSWRHTATSGGPPPATTTSTRTREAPGPPEPAAATGTSSTWISTRGKTLRIRLLYCRFCSTPNRLRQVQTAKPAPLAENLRKPPMMISAEKNWGGFENGAYLTECPWELSLGISESEKMWVTWVMTMSDAECDHVHVAKWEGRDIPDVCLFSERWNCSSATENFSSDW